MTTASGSSRAPSSKVSDDGNLRSWISEAAGPDTRTTLHTCGPIWPGDSLSPAASLDSVARQRHSHETEALDRCCSAHACTSHTFRMAVPISKATLSPLGVVVDALSHTHYLTSSLVAQAKRFAHDNAPIPSMSVIMKIRTTESGGANGDLHLARPWCFYGPTLRPQIFWPVEVLATTLHDTSSVTL
jgi:hypothetical protein